MAESVATLFQGLLNPNQAREVTRLQNLQQGEMMANTPAGRASLLFAPQQVTAAGRLGRRLAGQDPRTTQEIEAEENRQLFTRISQEAQRRFPQDRTAQLNYLAEQLTANGKIEQAQKARALAQQSSLTQAKTSAEIATEQAQRQGAQIQLAEAQAKAQGLQAVGDILRKRGENSLATAVENGGFDPEEALKITRPAKPLDIAGQSLSDLMGIPANILQSYDPVSVQKANEIRISGPNEGESQASFLKRLNNALYMPPEKVLSKGESPESFSDFTGIADSLLDDYSTSSRQRARSIYAEGAKEGETRAQFQKRIIDSLQVGLSTEQKKRASELAQSARVAVDGKMAFNKFFTSIDQAITGTGADFFVGLGRLINTLGGDLEGVTESEYIQRLLSNEVLNSAQMMSGALSDNDIRFLVQTVGDLGNTKEALKVAFAQLEADKLLDQIVYNAYMRAPDKANFNEAEVVRQFAPEVYNRVSKARNVNLLGN